MKKLFLVAFLTVFTVFAQEEEDAVEKKAPAKKIIKKENSDSLPCGKVGTIKLLESMDNEELEWEEDKFKARPTLAEGEKFAVVYISLKVDKSVGKYDYTLNSAECLAMGLDTAIEKKAFNPINWEYSYDKLKDKSAKVKLLYKVSGNDTKYTLAFKYKKIESIKNGNVVLRTSASKAKQDKKAADKPADGNKKMRGKVELKDVGGDDDDGAGF
ncbi:MAG: hypothetical protein HRT89_17510 [Lentisphaeria bacterium]|nr:hypothetical protein [Lentisphaeria bacterium]NQZ69856.1 hypothetical protein [Lentisphaeria bacterium]